MLPLSIAAGFALPSIERRLAIKAMETAKRRAMGLPVNNGIGFLKKVEDDINFVKGLKPGIRKSVNEFFMKEGPTSVIYLPSAEGIRLGGTLNRVTKDLPVNIREDLSNMLSTNRKKSEEVIARYADKIDNFKHVANDYVAKLPKQLQDDALALTSMDPTRTQEILNKYKGVKEQAELLASKFPGGASNMTPENMEALLTKANKYVDTYQWLDRNKVPLALTAVGGAGAVAGGIMLYNSKKPDMQQAVASKSTLEPAFKSGFEGDSYAV